MIKTVFAAALLALSGCGKKGNNSSSKDSGGSSGSGESTESTPSGGDAEVPVEAGKLSFYFTLGSESVAIPEYAAVYLCGGFNLWKTAPADAVKMQKLGETNVYYGLYEIEASALDTMDKGHDFQLTIGYTPESGNPSTGVNWSYKSLECAAAGGDSGLDNLQFTVGEDSRVNLGTHNWDKAPGPVMLAENVTFSVTLKEAAPEYVKLFAPGNYANNWACSPAEDAMTPSADRKTWSKTISSIAAGTYELQVIVEYADVESFTWGHKLLNNGDNYTLMVLTTDSNKTIDINEEDLDGEPIEFDFSVLPDPTKVCAVSLEVVMDAALTVEGRKWWVMGGFNGWAAEKNEAVVSADGMKMTADLGSLPRNGEIQFAIAIDGWHIGLKANGENFVVTVLDAETAKITITVEAGGAEIMNGEVTEEYVNANGVAVIA